MKPVPLHHPPAATKVWDPFVRIFHWSLVSCVVLNQFVLEPGKTAHEWVGYTASALVLARLVWGFVGSRHARFSDFFPTPRRLAKDLGVTGWMQTTDTFFGEEWLMELHEVLANGLLLAAGLHAAAAIVMGRLERAGLVRAMVTGTKQHF